ncbi:hypothetical protein BJX70DRAFT_49147 [Aspergillus crustosus]
MKATSLPFHNASCYSSPPSPFPFLSDRAASLLLPTVVIIYCRLLLFSRYLPHTVYGWSAEMLSLALCVPIHTEVLFLNEDTCADLVNRFGGKVIRIIFSSVELSSTVLKGAKKGGHIRWHTLIAGQTKFSSDYRDGCLNTYTIKVWLDESVLRAVPDVLDESEVRQVSQLEQAIVHSYIFLVYPGSWG